MPISPIVLQRRHAELGRIRLGDKQPTSSGKTRPNKLSTFRLTSPSERYIRDLAELYGGQAQQWDNSGKPEWEVYTTATSIPVIAVKGGLSQWMETWAGGGCVHRCDGERQVDGTPCDPADPQHDQAKPTTRLSVMLPELEALGVWRMESHGWNAAAEIPTVAELAQYVGDLVPAHLHLVERRAVRDGKTSRFVVPVLDLQIGTQRLRQLAEAMSSGTGELAGPVQQTRELEAPKQGAADQQPAAPQQLSIPTPEQISAADLATLRSMVAYLEQHDAGDHPAAQAARSRIEAIEQVHAQQPDEDGAVDAEVVEDGDADAIWEQIVKTGGQQGLTLSEVTAGYAEFSGGLIAADATAGELAAYLQHLKAGVPA